MELFSTQFGSRLYGTATPESDLDLKTIVLPELNELIVGTKLVNKVKQTREGPGKNTADDVDVELLPLQVFAKDFLGGQTYALEIAFSFDGHHAQQTIHGTSDQQWLFIQFMRELRTTYVTSNINAMVGYAVHQANLYSLKGERLNALDYVIHAIKNISLALVKEMKLEEIPNLKKMMGDPSENYFKWTTYEAAQDKHMPCFKLLEKTFPLSITLEETQTRLSAMRAAYGARAKQASVDNVDWKALMHAVRVSMEAEELLAQRYFTLPFSPERVAYLLSIKRGEQPLELVKDELHQRLEQIKSLQKSTSLPPASDQLSEKFKLFLTYYLRLFYKI